MKRIYASLVLTAFFVPAIAQSQIKLPSFNDLCSYDSEYCSKVGKVRDGKLVVKLPDATNMRYYQLLRPLIVQIAEEYKIDPVTLVLTPLTENTLNVHTDDKIADFLDEQGQLDDDGAVTNPALKLIHDKPMSIGPGQIYVSAAKRVEPLAA
ncbi:hypothetical protein EON65_10815, partial [archaeon]